MLKKLLFGAICSFILSVNTVYADNGAILGAIAGAVIGSNSSHQSTRILAPIIGATIGSSIDRDLERQRQNERYNRIYDNSGYNYYDSDVEEAYRRGIEDRIRAEKQRAMREAYNRGYGGY